MNYWLKSLTEMKIVTIPIKLETVNDKRTKKMPQPPPVNFKSKCAQLFFFYSLLKCYLL